MPFQLCLNTSTIQPVPLLDKIRLAAKHRFDAIELWFSEIYAHIGGGGEVREVEHALADGGLTVPSMISLRQWGEAPDVEYPSALDEAKRRLDLAARLGARTVVATPPRLPCPEENIVRRYRDLLLLGKERGVRPTFEYISFFESVFRLDQAWSIVQQADSPDATLVLDAFHTWNGGGSLEDLAPIPGEKISHYHIDDAARDKPPRTQLDPDRVLPGDGVIDLKSELRLLREKGYRGAISLELFNPELWKQDPDEVLRRGRDRLVQLLAELP